MSPEECKCVDGAQVNVPSLFVIFDSAVLCLSFFTFFLRPSDSFTGGEHLVGVFIKPSDVTPAPHSRVVCNSKPVVDVKGLAHMSVSMKLGSCL